LPSLKEKDEAHGDITKQDREDLMRERITTLRGIKVVGFKDVEDEMITTSNTYGFQTAVNYDENGFLVCEAAIPMSFFHIADPAKNEWAFNFRINGMEHKAHAAGDDPGDGKRGANGMGTGGTAGGGRGHGGRGGGSHNSLASDGEGHDALFKTEDFWEKFYLAK
jgi:YD repeat-containing protein